MNCPQYQQCLKNTLVFSDGIWKETRKYYLLCSLQLNKTSFFFLISLFCLFDSVIFVYADFAAPNKFLNSLLSSLNFISYEFRELWTCTEVKSPNAHNMTNFTPSLRASGLLCLYVTAVGQGAGKSAQLPEISTWGRNPSPFGLQAYTRYKVVRSQDLPADFDLLDLNFSNSETVCSWHMFRLNSNHIIPF